MACSCCSAECVLQQTDEDSEIYMSVMQLRDQTDELQSEVELRERTGDVRGAEFYQQKLNTAQQQLLEKNKIRSVCLAHHLVSFTLLLFSCSTQVILIVLLHTESYCSRVTCNVYKLII